MDFDSKELGKRIALRRTELGMSATELATAIGVSKSYINNLENGNYFTPSINKLYSIAEALSTTPDKLLEGNLKILVECDETGIDKELSNLFYSLPIEAKECFLKILRSYVIHKEVEITQDFVADKNNVSEINEILKNVAELNEAEMKFVLDNLKLSISGIRNMQSQGGSDV